MSRYILGDCVQVMSRFPARAVDFILGIRNFWLIKCQRCKEENLSQRII